MKDIEELEVRNRPVEIDPVDWLHQHREEILQKYPTFEARREYYNQFSSVEEALARVRAKTAEKKRDAK